MISPLSSVPLIRGPFPSDAELAAAAREGDEAAFAELIARHRPLIIRIVRRRFRRADEVDELVQLSLVEAWRAIGSFRNQGPDSLAAWLARITINTCYDELRRQRRSRESLCGEESFPAMRASTIEAEAISRDLAHKLLAGLSPDDRLVFTMLKADDFSVSEIARLIGWSEAKVKMRVHRAKALLRRKSRRLL